MRQKQQVYLVFITFALLSLLILIVSPWQPFLFLTGAIQRIFSPLQKSVYVNLGMAYTDSKNQLQSLQEENLHLKSQLAQQNALQKDNQALRDQFAQRDTVSTEKLLPVKIISMNTALPGNVPTELTINAGAEQGLRNGMAVLYKDILLGIIAKVSDQLSVVTLTTNKKISLSAKTVENNALGILKGDGEGMLFTQVLLSEKLKEGDVIATRGDISSSGIGYPADLLIGKIKAVNKKPSALFQSASVSRLIDVTHLSTVFVYKFR